MRDFNEFKINHNETKIRHGIKILNKISLFESEPGSCFSEAGLSADRFS